MLALRVGSNSEWGKTLEQLQGGEEPETPLQKKLKQLAYLIGITSLSVFIVESNIFNVRFNFY
jgi:magnesium-transporting ATPase (P-type)